MVKKISIIIPVYNVEKYLDRCVQSVINQTYSSWEMILVDDGSPDNCPQMCDEYANLHTNILAIHQNNMGLADARNSGIEKANGDLILFLDADDWISNDALEIINESFPQDAELLFTDYTIIADDGKKTIRRKQFNQSLIDFSNDCYYNKEILEKSITRLYREADKDFEVSAWTVIYSCSFIKGQNLLFPHQTALLEDKAYILNCISQSERIYYKSISVYNYFKNSNTLSTMTYDGKTDYVIPIFERLWQYVKEIKCIESIQKKPIISHFVYHAMLTLLWRTAGTKDKELKLKSRTLAYKMSLSIINSGIDDFPLTGRVLIYLIKNKIYILAEEIIKIKRSMSNN